MFNVTFGKVATWFLLFIQIQISGSEDSVHSSTRAEKRSKTGFLVLHTKPWHFLKDQTSPRTNTLFDDADDIQRQLDNEARDRFKCGKQQIHWPDINEIEVPSFDPFPKAENTIEPFMYGRILKLCSDEVGNRVVEVSPKTVWVFHLPTQMPTKLAVIDSDQYMKKDTREIHRRSCVPVGFRSGLQVDFAADITTPNPVHQPIDVTSPCPPEQPTDVQDKILSPSYLGSLPKPKYVDTYIPPPPPSYEGPRSWDYLTQNEWSKDYPHCKGLSQSPVNLPTKGLLEARGARPLFFLYYNVPPTSMRMQSDGQRVMLYGDWPPFRRPLVYGGAVHSRRYLFHSITVHWPSEHRIGGQVYPAEMQTLFISAEYKTIEDALGGYPKDRQAILGIVNLYKYGDHTHKGLEEMMKFNNIDAFSSRNFSTMPLKHFNPPFAKYVCYQGSLTVPPCTETVIWFIRARALPVKREFIDSMEAIVSLEPVPRRHYSRLPQHLNDRKVFIVT